MFQVRLAVLLASVCLAISGDVLRGAVTQDSGAEGRRLEFYVQGPAARIITIFVVSLVGVWALCRCLWVCLSEEDEEEKLQKLKQEAAAQIVDEAMWQADFFGPHPQDPGQRMEILTERFLSTSNSHGTGFSRRHASDLAKQLLAKHSHEAGVGLRYLLSEEFGSLARRRTGSEDPTFNDMKQFWLGENPIGQGMLCPRDLRAGCAMVDWIPCNHRHKQTHFMSWTWKYSLSQLQSALRTYEGAHATTFFFMCFFCNNQFRILIEGSVGATSDLEQVFKKNLSRIGQMVAILDTFQTPIYLKRVWTIYEQFIAYSSDIPVTFLMPEASSASLLLEVSKGSAGISFITQAVSQVDSARAEAWKPEDEQMVKDAIRRTVGFEEVDKHVKDVMIRWIGRVVQQAFQALVLAPLPVANGQGPRPSPGETGPESTLSWKRLRMCCEEDLPIDPASELIIPCDQQD